MYVCVYVCVCIYIYRNNKCGTGLLASQMVLVVKNLPANAGDTDFIPGSGRSPGGGHGKSLQYSCLENPHEQSLVGYSPWDHRVGHN